MIEGELYVPAQLSETPVVAPPPDEIKHRRHRRTKQELEAAKTEAIDRPKRGRPKRHKPQYVGFDSPAPRQPLRQVFNYVCDIGHKFQSTLDLGISDVRCPKCQSTDVQPDIEKEVIEEENN